MSDADKPAQATTCPRSMRDVGGIETPDALPCLAVMAQAMCLVDCAQRRFRGCTFDGLVCLDRPGAEAEAREALRHDKR